MNVRQMLTCRYANREGDLALCTRDVHIAQVIVAKRTWTRIIYTFPFRNFNIIVISVSVSHHLFEII